MARRIGGLIAALIFGLTISVPASAADRPNVIVILTDDQGTADLGRWARPTSKRLISMQSPAAAFDSASSTRPARSARRRGGLLTGRHPFRAGMPSNAGSEVGRPGMPTSEVTIAEMLRSAGYATGLIGKWHLGFSPETMPQAQGFDFSFGHMGGCIDNYSHFFYWEGPNRHDLYRDGRELQFPGRFFGDLMVEQAAGFLERNRDRPFFLYFAINAPHYPYQGDPKWLARYAGLKHPRNLYAAFLSTMDERIGRLMQRIDALGLRGTHDCDRPVRPRPFDRREGVFAEAAAPASIEARSSAFSKAASACRRF